MSPPTPSRAPSPPPGPAGAVLDRHRRPLGNLRISVTDRCNLRCSYCMPGDDYTWLPRADLLTFEEIRDLARTFRAAGVRRVRLTGGEPLLRRDLPRLVALLAELAFDDLALTTNGVLLAGQARALREAGLHRVTVSLDTLRRERFERLTRADELERVHAGIEAVRDAGFRDSKLDTVVMAGVNDDEPEDLIAFGRDVDFEVRFIEYMDVGGATGWTPTAVVSRDEILRRLGRRFGPPRPAGERGSAPADRYALPDGTVFGIIASTTAPFCAACDRSRLTADGLWYRCLYALHGTDLRTPLRAGATPDELLHLIEGHWRERTDRGAEDRLRLAERGTLAPAQALRDDPHLEMHTRGG